MFENSVLVAVVINYRKVADSIRSGRYSEALAFVQEALSRTATITPSDLLIRSRVLQKTGAETAAKSDIQRALSINPLDPDCLELASETWPEMAEEYALRFIGSPISQRNERRKFLSNLVPLSGPHLVLSTLPTMLRATLVSELSGKTTIKGRQEGDFQTLLPSSSLASNGCVAIEYFFPRRMGADRHIQFRVGDAWQQDVTIPSLGQEDRKGSPEKRLGNAVPWILIPVHNGGDVVARCLSSVLTALGHCPDAKVLIVDDLSSDADTLSVISQAGDHPRVFVHRTGNNLGFIGAVNTGLNLAGEGPVLLLNSDTYLPEHGLNRLMAHLQEESVGTVTPFSNNAGSFTLPAPRKVFEMPDARQSEALSQAAYAVNRGKSVDVLNGNGFAMLISETCRHALPQLSEDFDGGYYEEVEYSLRAAKIGLRNICATDCFVAHEGGRSFGERKKMLAASNLERLLRVFPDYFEQHEKYARCDPLSGARRRLLNQIDWRPTEVVDDTILGKVEVELARMDLDVPVLPVRGSVDPSVLTPWMSRIALISEQALSAQRLHLRPSHGFTLECRELPGQRLRLRLVDFDNTLALETELSLVSIEGGEIGHFERRCFERIKCDNE